MILEDASIQPQHCSLFVTLNTAQKTTPLSAIFSSWGHDRQHRGVAYLAGDIHLSQWRSIH